MTPSDLRQWLLTHNYSKQDLHAATGLSRVTIDKYLNGEWKIKPIVVLALKWLERKDR